MEKMNNELERIINEDKDVYNLNNAQIQRLQKVIYENKKLLQEEMEALNALENYVKCQPSLNDIQNSNNNGIVNQTRVNETRKTYSRKKIKKMIQKIKKIKSHIKQNGYFLFFI